MYQLLIKPRAILMAKEAYDWYEQQKVGLGEEFLTELDLCYKKIQKQPSFYSIVNKNFRQASLKRFPYVVVYEIFDTDIVVFAVFHTRRNPTFKFKDK